MLLGSTLTTGQSRLTSVFWTAGAIGAGWLQVRPRSSEKVRNAWDKTGDCPTQVAVVGTGSGQIHGAGLGRRFHRAVESDVDPALVRSSGCRCLLVGDIEMNQVAAGMLDEEQHVERLEGQGLHHEQVRGPDPGDFVAEESAPG